MDAGRLAARVAVAASLVATLAGALPWHRSGTVVRSGFAIVRSVERLGLADDAARSLVIDLWFLLPIVVALAVVAWSAGNPTLAAVIAGLGGVVALLLGLAVATAPGGMLVGPAVAVTAGAVAAGAAAVAVVAGRPHRGGGNA